MFVYQNTARFLGVVLKFLLLKEDDCRRSCYHHAVEKNAQRPPLFYVNHLGRQGIIFLSGNIPIIQGPLLSRTYL